ncbi:SPASM domain-containing protein [uncultured Megasphaera sp.]|uniref:SPASM domain-containing protein n=1 Tax=uncultured Megasphaera sp. TaxID=165188 RepID=UPI0026735DF5|nr:SPASM domain-containing protein [uncultured Megasphaera sp.]
MVLPLYAVGNDASLDLLPTEEQRAYMVRRVREIRSVKGGKPIFAIDFQNDGQFIDGCVAGGRNYCHINPNGDVEPCVFIHYSSANINNQSLLSCLQQPLFKEYAKGQPFNHNHLRPCPMLENPQYLAAMVKRSGAKSTDLQSPESAEHLCNKCKAYAVQWKPTADKLWAEIEANKEKEAAEKKVHSPQSATH